MIILYFKISFNSTILLLFALTVFSIYKWLNFLYLSIFFFGKTICWLFKIWFGWFEYFVLYFKIAFPSESFWMNLKIEYCLLLSLVSLILTHCLYFESLFSPTLPWILPSLKSEFNLEFRYKKWFAPAN